MLYYVVCANIAMMMFCMPSVGSGVVRIDLLHFLAGYHIVQGD